MVSLPALLPGSWECAHHCFPWAALNCHTFSWQLLGFQLEVFGQEFLQFEVHHLHWCNQASSHISYQSFASKWWLVVSLDHSQSSTSSSYSPHLVKAVHHLSCHWDALLNFKHCNLDFRLPQTRWHWPSSALEEYASSLVLLKVDSHLLW